MRCINKDFVKMAPSSKQKEMNIASSMNVLVKVKHINLVVLINEVAIFHLRELLASVDRLLAANESSLNIIQQSIVLQN